MYIHKHKYMYMYVSIYIVETADSLGESKAQCQDHDCLVAGWLPA